MSNLNQGVEEYLKYYCDFGYAPHYAVLVSGAWGAGKTHVVKRFLRSYEEQHTDQPKHLYVSLYGVTSFREIEDAFFRQLHPVLASKGMKLAASLARGLLRTTLKIDIKGEDTSINSQVPEIDLPSYLTSTVNRILVFDDIERCEIPTKRILGYINSLVEHDNSKAILIANEEELFPTATTTESEHAYGRIKEKLIGITLEVRPEFDEALTEFIDDIDDSESKLFYEAQREELRAIFGQCGSDNLRILQQTMWDFERLRGALSEEHRKRQEAVQKLFRLFFALSFEFKRGHLKSGQIADLQGQSWAAALRRVNSPDHPQTPMEQLQQRYPDVDFNQTMIAWTTLRDVLAKGLLNAQEINASLNCDRLFAPVPEPAWITLWHGFERTDKQVNSAIVTIERQLEEQQFVLSGEILHVTGLRLYLARLGALPKTLAGVVQEMKSYIDNLVRDQLMQATALDELSSFGIMAWRNLGFYENETGEFREVKEYLDIKRREVTEAGYPDKAEKLLEEMARDSSLFFRRICISNSSDGTFISIPIFIYVDPNEFVQRLLHLPRSQQRTALMALGSRYDHVAPNSAVAAEIPWLQLVATKLQSAASNMQPVARDAMEKNLAHWIRPVLERFAEGATQSSDAPPVVSV